MSTRRGRPGRVTLSRDTLSFIGGWGLMVYEAVAAQPFNTIAFLGGMVISGVPGAVQVLSLFISARTAAQLSDSPVEASSSQ